MKESSYEIIADEYYDDIHLTSRNFDTSTFHYCSGEKYSLPSEGLVLELGAGKGNANKYFQIQPNRIIQTDISRSMLSIQPRENCLLALTCNALDLPFIEESFSIVIALLYDPYNKPILYDEIYRVLKRNGIFIGTMPHYIWGSTLRFLLGTKQDIAKFRKYRSSVVDHIVELNSYLMDDERLSQVILQSGLEIMKLQDLFLPENIQAVSPDIIAPARSLNLTPFTIPVVKFIMARKL